jgi:TorA maturation chaperone TorD
MSAPAVDEAAIEAALGRAAVYRVLSLAFAHPTPARLEEVGRAAVFAAGSLPASCADALRALGEAATAVAAQDVAAESVFLFDGAVRCAPYEGAYGPATMAGKGAALADIAGFYAAFGLASEGGAQPETEDHIAAELEFMSALAVKDAWARLGGNPERVSVTREAQAAFLEHHLARWTDAFADAMRATTTLPYYLALADALAAWVGADAAALGVAVAAIAERSPADEAPLACPMSEAREVEPV